MDITYLYDGYQKNKTELHIDKLNNKEIKINKILDELIKYLCIHIKNQISAGADVIQIFDLGRLNSK